MTYMGQALYRSKRPKSFDEVIGQDHIVKTLRESIKQSRVAHAYLFTGPRGVGKTSVARIFAHDVNGLEYDDDSMHLDIIEIDAASNRRIDEVRELREVVRIAPTSTRYKVIIIDEVHMLTREAFNALLKTLEEPPDYVIFILATTEVHKLPATIISRTQRFNFSPISEQDTVKQLKHIASSENITVDDDALELIAKHSEGSLRDGLSLLDQLSSGSKVIGRDVVRSMVGEIPDQLLSEVLMAVSSKDLKKIILTLDDLKQKGYEPTRLSQQLSQRLRNDIIGETISLPRNVSLQLLAKLIEVPASYDPLISLQIALMEAVEIQPVISSDKPATKQPAAKSSAPLNTAKPPSITSEAPIDKTGESFTLKDDSLWPQILETIKQQYNTLYGIARMANASFSDDTLTLRFHFPFHQKRLNDPINRKIIKDAANELSGRVIEVVCQIDTSLPKPESNLSQSSTPAQKISGDPEIVSIRNIFGGAELLQSE